MSEINNLYDRNHRFAVGFDQAELAILPRFSTVILTCIDARVDPAHFLDLKLGDAIVLRNAGGRVTEAVERELAILFAIANQVADGEPPELSLAIIHHSDCGLERLASPQAQEAISQRSGVDLAVLQSLGIADHNQSLVDDVDRLQRSNLVPDELVVSAHLYNVKSGRINQVIPAAPLVEIGSQQ
jgi:carbonic anhydrase